MNRKRQREAYVSTLKGLVDFQQADPEEFERSRSKFIYIRSLLYFAICAYLFHSPLTQLLFESNTLFIKLVQDYPLRGTIAMIALGVILYVFRERSRYYYGLTEAAFACTLIHVCVNELSSPTSQKIVTLGAALYVLVRGIDNLVQGFKNPQTRIVEKPKAEPGI